MSRGIIQIDFTYAKIISDRIDDQKTIASDIANKNGFDANGLPGEYFKTTIANMTNIRNKASAISESIEKLSYAFDSSVEKYYQMENDIQSETPPIVEKPQISKGFVWGYKEYGSQINRMDNSELVDLMLAKGAKQIDTNVYEININGNNYKYSTRTRTLYVNKVGFKCDFYVSNNYQNSSIDNTVTLLGGTGQRQYGPMGDNGVTNDIGLSDKSVLIVPYSGEESRMLDPGCVKASSEFTEEVFNANRNVSRSVVGFSEGTRVASQTISEYPNLFDNVVFVNGSTRFNENPTMTYVQNGNYDGFKDANIYYIITHNGWNVDSVTQSVNDLIKNGVDPSKITLISNEASLNNLVNQNINFDDSMPPSNNTGFISHGRGAWEILNKSEIINYLSKS